MSVFPNGRGVGITDLLQGYGEWPVIVLFALITQLGDVWFLFLLSGGLYVAGEEFPRWGIERRRGLFVLALVLAYVALIGVLKNLFALPRPPGAGEPALVWWMPSILVGLFNDMTTATGPGFPSGHALGSTMVWGGLALVLEREPYRLRFGVAGVIVALISFSRLVLGVHYFVDIVVGFGLGLLVLGVLYWLSDRGTDPERVLLFAVVAGIIGLFVGVTFESVTALGGAVGGWLVWRGAAEMTPAHPSNRWEVVAAFSVLGSVGGLFGIVYAVEPSHMLAFLGAAIAGGGAVGAPILGERLV